MTTSHRLETYLTQLDKALKSITVSERAEIITEIKSHIFEAQQKDPSQTTESICAALGEPENVANRYLLERGLTPAKAPKRQILKWLVIGFLGTLTIFLLALALLIWKFTPILEVDEDLGRVRMLGGLLKFSEEDSFTVRQNFRFQKGKHTERLMGSKSTDESEMKIQIPFRNGKFDLLNSTDNRLRWDCEVERPKTSSDEKTEENDLDLSKTWSADCDIFIPEKFHVALDGANGEVILTQPRYSVDILLANGKVEMNPDPSQSYRYDFRVTNGKVDQFTSSPSNEAILISASLQIGSIERRD